jgi:hypothetical protein
LNSLANHGILPRNGRGMTLPILTKGIWEGLHVAPDMTIPVGTVAMLSSNNPLGLSFDLDDLDKHDQIIEHDGSLSRNDAFFGDNHSFNRTIWQEVLNYFENDETVSITAAAKARFNRIKQQSEANPDFTYTVKNLVISYTETAQYLSTFGGPVNANPPVEWVRVFFGEQLQ